MLGHFIGYRRFLLSLSERANGWMDVVESVGCTGLPGAACTDIGKMMEVTDKYGQILQSNNSFTMGLIWSLWHYMA